MMATARTGRGRNSERPPKPATSSATLVAMVALDTATESMISTAARSDSRSMRSPRAEAPLAPRPEENLRFEVESFTDMRSARAAFERLGTQNVILVTESIVLRTPRSFPAHVHVIALLGPDGAHEAIEADDLVRRPIDTTGLTARLRAAARRLLSEQRTTVVGVLRDAMRKGMSGEVIVSLGDDSARVHVDRGKIAWVHRSVQPISMQALLEQWGIVLDKSTCHDVLEESRVTRRHFGDVLVEWGLIEAARLRDVLKRHVAGELQPILEATDATASFVQQQRPFTSSLAFEESEVWLKPPQRRIETRTDMQAIRSVMAPAGTTEGAHEPPRTPELDAWILRMRELPDVLGSMLVDAKTGQVLHRVGTFADAEERIVWSLVAALSALGDGGDEVLATARSATYLARPVRHRAGAVFVVHFDSTKMSAAMARLVLSRLD